MDIQTLYSIAKRDTDPLASDIDQLREIVERFPYFQSAIFSYIKSVYLFENEKFDKELTRLSIGVSDRRALFYYILSEDYDQFFKRTGKKEIKEDKTNILLNAFFESRGESVSEEHLEYNLSYSSLISTDYLSYMETTSELNSLEDKETVHLKHQNIIDSFIFKSETEGGIHIPMTREDESTNSNPQEDNNTADNVDELDEDMFFTETLAKIYVKQKKYEKAYKIIKHLSLNYPKKNIYFADQLIFLEKLIINSKYKDTK